MTGKDDELDEELSGGDERQGRTVKTSVLDVL